MLVADAVPFLRRFDNAPLIYPVLFKTIMYTLFVFVARLIEAFIHYLVQGGILGGGRFINHLFGDGELFKVFFTRRSSELKSSRCARIRLFARLGRLTEAHSIEVLSDARSAPHTELVGILRDLSRENRARCSTARAC